MPDPSEGPGTPRATPLDASPDSPPFADDGAWDEAHASFPDLNSAADVMLGDARGMDGPQVSGTHAWLDIEDPWDEPEPAPRRRGGFRLGALAETLEVIALALAMFLLVRTGMQNFVVDGDSMSPTFHNGEMVIVNKLAYRTFDVSWLPWTDEDEWSPFGPGTPQPGDVVVFHFPQSPDRDFIKRVIATAGQTVEIADGTVWIDGVPVDEPYIEAAPEYRFGPETVPEGYAFVLGDNRNNSYDSHSWGMLDLAQMVGRAEFRYWPPGEIGRVGHDAAQAQSAAVTGGEARVPSSP